MEPTASKIAEGSENIGGKSSASLLKCRRALMWPLIVGVVLMLGEASVRIFCIVGGELGQRLGKYEISPATMPIESYGENGYRQKPNRVFSYKNGTIAHSNAKGYRGPLVNEAKDSRTYRIILLGGSTTHGFGVNDDETIDAYLRRLLSNRFPLIRFEVINLAYDGYDAYQLYLRMRSDGVRFQPDMVIVNSGINDVRNVHIKDLKYPDPRTNGWRDVLQALKYQETHGISLYGQAKRYSYLARLPAFVVLLYEERQRVGAQRAVVNPNPQNTIRHFEASIREIAGIAQGLSATLILSTPASSLTTRYRPSDTSTISYWVVDAATTQQYRDYLAGSLKAIANDLVDRGFPATFVDHKLPGSMFLDDCHLTGEGNLLEATNLAEAAAPYIESWYQGRQGKW